MAKKSEEKALRAIAESLGVSIGTGVGQITLGQMATMYPAVAPTMAAGAGALGLAGVIPTIKMGGAVIGSLDELTKAVEGGRKKKKGDLMW